MKKLCTLLLLLTLTGMMCACAQKGLLPETAEATYGSETEGQTAFMDILEGNGTFCRESISSVEEVTLDQYCETFTDTLAAAFTNAALADLEQDGTPEVVLQIALGENSDCGVLVLHWENEKVWGYTFSNRQMGEIKADGTFHWSGSSSNHGIATAAFSQGKYTYHDIVWVEEVDNKGRFYKGGEEITEDAFNSCLNQFEAQENAHWIPYSDRTSLFG